MKDGAILANTGHFNVEIEIPALRELAVETREARALVDEFTLADGRRLYLIGDGRLVNLAAAEGHPAIVMDMSFANQALSAEWVVENGAGLERRVYDVPEGDRRGDRAAQAGDDGPRDRPADRRAARSTSRSWDEGNIDPSPSSSRSARCQMESVSSRLSRDRPARGRRGRAPRPAAAAGRGGRAALPIGGRGRGGHPHARDPRRAGDRRRRRVRLRARGARSARTSTPRYDVLVSARARPRSICAGRSTRCAPIPTPERARRHPRGGGRALPPHGRARGDARRAGLARPHALQHGRSRDRRVRDRARRDPAAWERGLVEHVWVDETRPLLQGARLTAWELDALGIPFSVIADGAAASLMRGRRGRLRAHRRRPHRRERRHGEQGRDVRARARGATGSRRFRSYVVAPTSTLDREHATGADIPIEAARPGRGFAALPGAEPRVRRHACLADRRDRDGGGRPPAAVRGVASRVRCAHEGARPRRRIRDAALPAHARPAEGAARGGREADARPRPRAARGDGGRRGRSSSRTRSSRRTSRSGRRARTASGS